MNILLVLAFLFFIGSVIGWGMELFFRRFFSKSNPERKWINPGFCTGPYLPIYGSGLCVLYLVSSLDKYDMIKNPVWNKIVLFAAMALCMTVIEYIAGLLCLKIFKVRLWDYSDEWGNIQGIICPEFSLIWAAMSAIYYFFIHPHILGALEWLSNNLAFSFFIGLFFGVFIIDVVHAANIVVKLKEFADNNDVVVRYEYLKSHIRSVYDDNKKKYHFFRPFKTEGSLHKHLKDLFEEKKEMLKEK